VAAAVLALVLAGPAQAANEAAPGAQKKQETVAAPAAQPRPNARAVPEVNGKQPVNQGTAKKITPAATQAASTAVEVIPGIVILALAWLAALSLMLILRTLVGERRRRKALTKSYGVTVAALATAIEAKDRCTGGHIERVRRLGLLLGAEIAPGEVKDPQMAYGFLLHDIGKLAVPDAILRAPGDLTDEQWALMRHHPEEGVRMLASVPFLGSALDIVRYHHERWDGSGYPDGLRGEEIPLWARIFSVVDALDAITAKRPYRPARSYDEALAEIRRHAGTQFDPAVVAALERIDPAVVEPLLEPPQQPGRPEPLAELPAVPPLVPA
jgi:ribonuclease P protein subunit RPR2